MFYQSQPEFKIGSCYLLSNACHSDHSFRINIIVSNFCNDLALTIVLKPFDVIKCKDDSCILQKSDINFLNSDHYVDFQLTYSMKLSVLKKLSIQQEPIQEELKIFKNKGVISNNCINKIQAAAINNKNKIKFIHHELMDHF